MTFSQNVRFSGRAPDRAGADDARPAGRGIASSLEEFVHAAGWEVLGVDVWRDCGWSLTCRRGESQLEVALAQMQPSEWMLQVAPALVPGWLARLRGRQPSADRDDVFELAARVHEFLSDAFGAQLWCWDGFPDEHRATPAPTRWQ